MTTKRAASKSAPSSLLIAPTPRCSAGIGHDRDTGHCRTHWRPAFGSASLELMPSRIARSSNTICVAI